MGRYWNDFPISLKRGKLGQLNPSNPRVRELKGALNARRRLDEELEKGLPETHELTETFEGGNVDFCLTPVERAMLRNAPDIMLSMSREEVEQMEARMVRRWPRPRLLGLILLAVVGIMHPAGVVRLMVWGVILFLVVSVTIGPEKAVDHCRWLGAKFLGMWRVEAAFFKRVLQKLARSDERVENP